MGRFQPGVSGNPNGRPKRGLALAEVVREKTRDDEDPLEFLLRVMKGQIKHARVADRIAAATELLNRGFGKPLQEIEVDVGLGHHSFSLEGVNREDLVVLVEEGRAAKAEREALMLEGEARESLEEPPPSRSGQKSSWTLMLKRLKRRDIANLGTPLGRFGGDPHEESAHTEKFFCGPVSVKLYDDGRLYVTNSNRHRIQIYERG